MKKILFAVFSLCIIVFSAKAQIDGNPSNPNNPFDNLGQLHNEGLDYILKSNPGLSIETFKENWIASVDEFLKSKDIDPKPFTFPNTNPDVIKQTKEFSFYDAETPEEELSFFYKKGLMSDELYRKINKLYSTVDDVQDLAIKYESPNEVFQVIKNRILGLENSLQDLKEDDVNKFQIASSILRYSSYYWINESTNSSSAWKLPKLNHGGMLFGWKSLFKSDAAGAVGGVVKFGVAAILGGPVGWGACGTAALGGAVGSSVTNAIVQLWK